MTHTLHLNLWAGPGVGKSSTAALVYGALKMLDVNAELVREYVKERCWLGDTATAKNQIYVSAKQYHRQVMVDGQVDVAITDSPILLGIIYQGRGKTPSFDQYLLELFNEFRNLNVFLVRNPEEHKYNPKGRYQTEEEAIAKDNEIFALLNRYNIPFSVVMIDREHALPKILGMVKKELIIL